MKKKYYTFEMDTGLLNIISIVLFVILIIITNFLGVENIFSGNHMFLSFVLMIPYLFLHEIFHSIAYVLHGASFKNVSYGAHIEKGILCCLCKQNIKKSNILISLIYPFVFLGVITYIIGICLNNKLLIFLSIYNMSGCSGDLIMFFSFLGIKNFEYSEYDNPTAFGLYSSDDLSKKKFLALKYIETKESLEITHDKKISISKTSIIFFIAIFIFSILFLFI